MLRPKQLRQKLRAGAAYLAIVAILAGGTPRATLAGVYTWLGATNTWETSGNWTPAGGPPGASDTALFDSSSGPGSTILLDGNQSLGNLIFGSGANAFTFDAPGTPNVLTLGDTGTIWDQNGSTVGLETLNDLIVLGPTFGTFQSDSSQGLLFTGAIKGSAATSATTVLNLRGLFGGLGTISGNIGDGSGGGYLGLNMSGAGMWTLTGDNTYSGGTTISGGTLNINNASALGSGSVLIDYNATLGTTTSFTTGQSIVLGTASSIGGGTIDVAQGTLLTLTSPISGTGGLIKTDGGTLVLDATNTYQGLTQVKGGNLVLSGSLAATGSTTATIGLTNFVSFDGTSNTSQLVLADGYSGFTLNANLVQNGGTGGSNAINAILSTGNNTLNGNLYLYAPGLDTFITSAAGMLTITGNLVGTDSAVFPRGPGNETYSGSLDNLANSEFFTENVNTTIILSGNNATYAGVIIPTYGTVRVSSGQNIGTGGVTFDQGQLEVRTDPSTLADSSTNFSTRNVTVGSNASGTGTLFIDRAVGGTGLNQTVAFNDLNLDAGHTLTITGLDGYGISFTGAIGVGDNGATDYGNAEIVNSSSGLVTINASLAVGSATGSTTPTNRTFEMFASGDMLATGSVIQTTSSTGTILPAIFEKAGTGTLTLSGTASTYTGGTEIYAGTLAINQMGALNGAAGGGVNLGTTTAAGALSYLGASGTGVGETTSAAFNLSGTTGAGMILGNQQSISTNTDPTALVLSSGVAATGAGAKNLILGGFNNTGNASVANTIAGVIQDNSTTYTTSLIKNGSGTWLYAPTASIYVTTAPTGATVTTTTPEYQNYLAVSSTTGLVVGESVSGTNVPAGSIITSISGSDIYINNPIAVAAGVTSGTGLTFGTVGLPGAAGENFTGNVTVAGGTLEIQPTASSGNGSAPLNAIAGATTNDITFAVDATTGGGYAGGTFDLLGTPVGITGPLTTQVGATLTLSAGAGTIETTPISGGGTPTLEFMNTLLTPITRSAGAVVDFIPGAGAIEFNTQPTTTNGILGGYAYFTNSDNTVDFATVSSELVAAYTGYLSFPASGSTSTSTYVSNSDVTTTGTESVYALKIAGAQTITLGGNLTIGSGGVLFDDSTGAATIAGTGSLGTSSTETIITVAGNTPANALTVSAPIDSSSGALTKAGNGTLIISGANTYTGNTTIDEGTIQLSGPSATLGKITTAANVTTLRQNTTLDLDGAGPLTGGVGTVVIGALAGAGTVTNSGGGSDTAVVLDIGYGTTTTASGVFSGILQNGDSGAAVLNVTKNGSGTEVLAGLNTYTGVTTIADGTLQASNLAIGGSASSIGASSNAAANLVFNGGTLLYQGSNTLVQIATASPSVSTDRLFTLAGNGTIDSSGSYGNDVLGSASANNAALVFSNTGAVVFSGSGTRTLGLQGTSISDNEIALQLVDNPAGGALSVTKAGVGLWYLSNDNSYSGATTISAGALRAQDGVGLSPNSNLVIAGGVLESSGVFTRPLGTAAGDVQFTATGGFAASSSQLQVAIGGTADPTTLTWGTSNFLANGAALILGSTSALSEVQILNPLNLGSAGQTINVVSNASTDTSYGTILGAISGGPTDTDGNATGLIKTSASAAGDLILAGPNSYTGNTVVSGGVLTIYSLGGTSAVTSATTSSLGASGSAVTADSIGVLQLTSGTLDYVGAGETSDRPIQLTSTSTSAFVLESNGSGPIILTNLTNPSPSNAKNLDLFGYNTDFNTILSNLTDTAADPLTITVNRSSGDDATWVLSGNNTFHGGVALADGTLGLGSNTAAGVGQISVNNAPALFATAPGIAIANNVGLNTSALLYVVGSNSFSVGTLYLGSTATAATSGTLNNEMTGGSFTVAAVSAQTGTTAQTLTFNGLGNTIVNGPITNGSAAGLAISYSGSGAGSLTLGGSTASTFTGAFTLAATGTATLILTNTSTPLGTGNFIWDAGTIGVNAVESLSNAVQLASGSTIGVSGSNSIAFTGGETFTTSHALTNNLTSGNTLTFATGTLALGSASSLTLAGTGSTVISSSITGTATTSLAMNGTGGLTLSGTDTLSGTTAANAGTLTLNFDTNNTNKLSTTAALILGGGTLALNRLSSATSFTQTIGSITLTSGSDSHITINNGGGAGTTNLASTGTITANLGAVFDFTPPSTGTGKLTVAAASSIYGWATIDTAGGNYFAANSAGTIVQATTTPVDLITSWTSTQNVTDSAGYNGTLSVNTTINSLRFNESSGASNVTMNSDVGLTITGGGILVTPSVGSAVDTITGGTLTAGTGVAELIVNQQNTSAPLTIASAIVNGSITNMPLVKASPGTLILTGANSYTGATYVNEGTLQLYGSGTLGILSNVVIGSTSTALLDLNGTSQTIGTLASSGVQTGLGTVDIDSGSLAITESSSTTYTGAFTGTGSLAVTGTGTLTLNTTSSPFAGAVTVGGTTVAGGLLELVGNGIANLPNVTSFALTDGGALQLDNTGSSTQVQRISPTATITLTNTPPSTAAAATPSGLSTVTDQVNSQNAIVGALTLGGGTNTLRAVTNTALANPQLTMASLTRTHYATLTILANDLGSSNGGGSTPPDSPVNAERGDIIVTDPTSLLAGLVGGSSNTLDTTTISILPWAMGQDETSAQYQVFGSSFVTYSTTLGNGFLALNPVTDYEQLVPTGGVTLLNNARYATSTSTSTGLTFTGTGHMVNSLLVDTTGSASGITVSGSGAGDSLVVNSGAMLFVGPQSITLTGFNSGIALGSGQTEYVFDVNNTTTTIASDLTTAGAVITKSGTGTLILNDALPNGPIYVNEGTLGLAATSAVTGNVTVESGASLSLLSAGDGTGSNQTITTMAAETFTFLAGAPTFTVGPVGTVPLNKTIEANFGNTISLAANTALTVNNNSGFGLLLGGTLSLSGTAPASISVTTATNSNVIEGLVIVGAVTGGQTGAGNVVLNKTGAGTLEFTGTSNTFGGSGSIIEVTQGVLAATSDAALGDPSNVIQLSPTTTASTFEALGT
ncbi:MAG TPA: autotransporter-associated beta strand repeat-containing protein, partial [Pirellulales bacterium]|nr:autotransporter-associated beta strand repeat-containing protein [Pirellulales bacterium]